MKSTDDVKNAITRTNSTIRPPMQPPSNCLLIRLVRKNLINSKLQFKTKAHHACTAHTVAATTTRLKIVIMLPNQSVQYVKNSVIRKKNVLSRRKRKSHTNQKIRRLQNHQP